MSCKLSLLLLGALLLIAVTSSSSAEENSLSKDASFNNLRTIREAAADPGKKKKKKSLKKKGKKSLKKKGKKSKKGRKAGKRKTKAKKNNKKKKGKKSRKGKRKGKKNKNGKKNRKGRRKGKKNRKEKNNKKGDKRMSGRAIDATCVTQLSLSMRRWKDVVTNFKRQSKRITDFRDKGSGKSNDEKLGIFAPVADKLVRLGGGNKSALQCGGSTTSEGAATLASLVTELTTCSININATCHPDNFPEYNQRIIDECGGIMEQFEEAAEKCLGKTKVEASAEEGCECWTDPDMVQLTEDVVKCKVKDHMNTVKDHLKKCTDIFKACKKLEDAAVEIIHACQADPAVLAKEAAALTQTSDALAGVQEKIKALTASRRHRVMRAPATTCQGLIDLVAQCKIN